MQDRHFSSKGFIISRKNYSDSDRILTLLTERYGKIRVIAKGIRKPRSKKRGHLEVFSYIKFSSQRGKSGMGIMTEVETLNFFPAIRNDLGKVAVAYFYCEVVDKITSIDENNQSVFELLLESFEKLGKSDKLKSMRNEFMQKILISSGFLPKTSNPERLDKVLENILEKKISSRRIGKKIIS